MKSTDLIRPDTVAILLPVLSWCLIAFAALWLITGVIGFFHRRAYNLTHAESGRSKKITPDFLKIDRGKRQAAVDRGAAYDAVLDAREQGGSIATVAKVCFWSRLAAILTATLTVIAAVVGTLKNVESFQEGAVQLSSWERFSRLVSDHRAGAVVALAVIGANIVVYVKALKNIPEKD